MRRLLLVLLLSCRSEEVERAAPPCSGAACDAVGVVSCAEGFRFDSVERACSAQLPAECAPGTIPEIGKGECQPVGVAKCAPGFASDGGGSCSAILPSVKCPNGKMAVPGDKTCAPVSACPAGRWPDVVATLHVDASATEPGDGSSARPFPTVQKALDAASDGATIAIAAGSYAESVRLLKRVTLVGVCPEKVEIKGASPTIDVAATSTVRGIAVTGVGAGIKVSGVAAQIEQVWVHDTTEAGMMINAPRAMATKLSRVLVEGTRASAVAINGATVVIENSVLRDTRYATDDLQLGRGVHVQARGSVTVRGSLLEFNRDSSVFAFGAEAIVENSVIRDTQPLFKDQMFGRGITGRIDPAGKVRATITVRGSVLERNRTTGIALTGADGVVVDSVIRDTRAEIASNRHGVGISATIEPTTRAASTLRMTTSVVEKNLDSGVVAFGSRVTVERSILRDNLPRIVDKMFGSGVHAEDDGTRATLELFGSLLDNNTETGVFVYGSDARIEGCLVRGTRVSPRNGKFGRGITLQDNHLTGARASATVKGCVIDRNREGGIVDFGSDLTVESTLVRDTEVDDQGLSGFGIAADVNPSSGARPRLTIKSSVIERNRVGGILLYGGEALIESTTIRDTMTHGDGGFGDGVAAMLSEGAPAAVTVSSSTILRSARAGLSLFGATGTLGSSRLLCNGFDLNLDTVEDVAPRTEDAGNNICGCGATPSKCTASSAKLTPAPPPNVH